jgi:tetratricopeptide (TPR) repeat protein
MAARLTTAVRGTRWIRPLLAALVWCATVAITADRAVAAERPWVEVRSPHFIVLSDAGNKGALRVAWQFEQVRAVIQKLWPWARLSTGKPFVVFAARDEVTLKGLVPKYWEVKGGMRPASVFVSGPDRLYVALRTDVAEPDSTQANPYFQTYWSYIYLVLQSSFDKGLPVWLGRGLSDLFANIIVRDKDLQVGRIVPWHLRVLRDGHLLPLATVLSVDRQSPYVTREEESRVFDASAWALVHYMTFGEDGANQPRMNRFSEALQARGDAGAALREVYGDTERLETTLRYYVGKTLFAYQQIGVDVNVSEAGFTLRTLSAAEAATDRAFLHAAMRRPVDARALGQEAMRVDPALAAPYEVEGLLCDMEGNTDGASTAYARAVDLGSTNFYAHYRHAQLLWHPTADQAALGPVARSLERTIELNADWAAGHSFLADVKTDLQDAEAAVVLARRAVALEPGASYHRATLARVLARLSKPAEALQEAEKALALAKNATERQRAADLVARLKGVSR